MVNNMAMPTHKRNKNMNYNNVGGGDFLGNWDFGILKVFGWTLLVLSIFMGMVAGCNHLKSAPWYIENSISKHEDTIINKVIAEIPPGKYLHRVVDKETGIVCYLNAVGGGMECFHIEEIELMHGKLPEDFMEKSKVSRYNSYTPNSHYTSKYKYNTE